MNPYKSVFQSFFFQTKSTHVKENMSEANGSKMGIDKRQYGKVKR